MYVNTSMDSNSVLHISYGLPYKNLGVCKITLHLMSVGFAESRPAEYCDV